MNRRRFFSAMAAGASSLAMPTFAQSVAIKKHALSCSDSNGNPVNLQHYAGKICLITFFTSGCTLCSAELKLMRNFYVANKARNFMMVGVNLDLSQNDFAEYTRIVNLSLLPDQRFPIVWRNAQNHSDSFGAIDRKPTHFVLDRNHGTVLRREGMFQPNDWDDLWLSLG
jgi:peroxiredoxin